MNIESLRSKIQAGAFTVYAHAVEEAMKDGLTGDDLLFAALNGEVIEEYPERQRCLLFALAPSGLPIHLVLDYHLEEPEIVTIYIPDSRQWIKFKRRKPPAPAKRKKKR